MSVETLESIKQKAEVLTTKEKHILVESLIESIKNDMKADIDKSFPNNRSDEEKSSIESQLEWLKTHRDEYDGQYVALDGDVLVGHGATIREAHEMAKQKGINEPFLTKVFSEETVVSGGL